VAAFEDSDSFVDFVRDRKELAYGVVQYDITPALTATAGVDYQHTNGVPQGTGVVFYKDGGDIGLPRSTYLGVDWNRRTTRTTNLFGDLTWQLGSGWRTKLAASYQWYGDDKVFLSASGSGVDRVTGLGPLLNYASASDNDNTQAGADMYASGPFNLFGRQHELVIGANIRSSNSISRSVALTGYDSVMPNVTNWDPTSLPAPVIGDYTSQSQIKTQQSGIYSTARLKLADPLTLMLGARVSWWKYDSINTNLTNGTVTSSGYNVAQQVTPYVGLVYELNDQFSVYASYTDIFQPQNAIDRYGKLLDPIVGANYEAGIKGEFMDGRLNASLAIFRIDQTNRAQTDLDGPKPCPYTTSDYCSIAEGKVRSEGIEIDVSGEIAPGWQLYAGHTFNTTKYVQDRANEGKQFNTRTPKHMTKLFTSYRLPGNLSQFTVGGGFTWQTEFEYSNTARTINIRQGAYAVASAMVRYDITPSVSATLNIGNLFDKSYYRRIAHERAYNYYGEPRSVMLSLRARFD
jgi:outer membrane receptor for ferric coprogen and ferric-rhodotorulic acid